MKGYQIDKNVYIFPNQDPAAIPEQQGATAYLIQHEELAAYKEINTTLADKLFGYNYNTMTVTPKPWKDHQDDELHKAGPTTLTLVFSDGCEQYIAEEYRYNSVQNNDGTVLYAAEGVYFKDMEWMSHNYLPSGAEGNPPEFDLFYTGGDAFFNNADDLFLNTHVDDETITEVTLSIVPRNYTGWQDVQVGEDNYENLKYRFVNTEQFTSFDVGSMYYAHEGNLYTLIIDGVDATFAAQNSTNEGVVTVRVYNPDTDETYFTQSSAENDLAEWTVQAGEGVTGEFIFTQVVPEQNSASFDDQTNEVIITLVDDSPFYSDALTTLFTDTPNFTITRDSVQLVNPTQNPEYDTQDPDNPVLLDVEYGDTDGSFVIYYDTFEQQYQCTNISGESYAGVYVFTPVQL